MRKWPSTLLLIISISLPFFVWAGDTEDINLLVERANQIVARMHDLQLLLGEAPGSRGVDLTTGESGGEVRLTKTMKLGSRDADSAGEVSILQQFLYDQYYYDDSISGTFTAATRDAVIDLQEENKQYLGTGDGAGVVGGATRELIRRISIGETLDDSIATFSVPVKTGPGVTIKPKPKPKPKRTINIIESGSLAGNIRKPLEASFTAYGGIGNYVWKLSGPLPPGITKKVDGDRLIVGGTPTDSGDFPVVIRATDKDGFTSVLNLSISIGPEIFEPVKVLRPTSGLEWLRGSYETIRWRGAGNDTFTLRLNYYSVSCPQSDCSSLTPSSQALIAGSITGGTYSWSVGKILGGPVPIAGRHYTISVCDARTGVCDNSGGFRLVDRATDLFFGVVTDQYAYHPGEVIKATFSATSKTALRKVVVFPTTCQLRWRLINSDTGVEVYNSQNDEICAETETAVTITPFAKFNWTGNIDTKNLAPGIYLLKADIGAGREAQTKVTVQ